jgi:hypothetical protein
LVSLGREPNLPASSTPVVENNEVEEAARACVPNGEGCMTVLIVDRV